MKPKEPDVEAATVTYPPPAPVKPKLADAVAFIPVGALGNQSERMI